MATDTRWQPFGVDWEDVPERGGVKRLHLSMRRPRRDSTRAPGSALITVAAVLLGLLAAGLFVVSLAAQYRYVFAEKHQALPAMIEAVGLDVGMAIFSLLALGLAMAGQSARVERALIVVCAAGSALMNYAAANGGSPRSVAAYVVPPVFLAIVVDRVVAVVRRHIVGDTERSVWAGLGRIALYGLRFVLAARSTAGGLRRQVLIMTPLPGKPAPAAIEPVPGVELEPLPEVEELPEAGEPDVEPEPEAEHEYQPMQCQALPWCPNPVPCPVHSPEAKRREHRDGSKTSQFLQLVQDRHGPLAAIDPSKVSRIAADLAPEVGLHPGSGRSALRPLVLAAQNGHSS